MMSSITVRGLVFGKISSSTQVEKTRAILPQPALMTIVDAMIASKLNTQIDEVLPSLDGCVVGARPKTQCLDIAHGLQSVIEKGLDDQGSGAVAQCDIQCYYDSLPALKIARWMLTAVIAPSLVACALRHQMLRKADLGGWHCSA